VGGTDTLPRGNADYVGPTDIIIIPHFDESVKSFSTTNPYAVYIPQAKAWGFDGGVLKKKKPLPPDVTRKAPSNRFRFTV